MPVLRIEHPVPDFEAWKEAFDADPLDRKGSGVVRYRVFRSLDDPQRVMVDLEFERADEAEAMRGALQAMWSRVAAEGLVGDQRAHLVESIDTREY